MFQKKTLLEMEILMKIIKGNLLNFDNDAVVVHQVNCRSVMGGGVAKALRGKYPTIYQDYMDFNSGKLPIDILGSVRFVEMDNNLTVVNMYSQLAYNWTTERNRMTDYGAMSNGFKIIFNYCIVNNISTVYIPFGIGCVLAGGSWDIVSGMIVDIESEFDNKVEVVAVKLAHTLLTVSS